MTSFETWLQLRLTSHGFPVGPIDGDVGPLTLDALEAFQKSKGLPTTRKADAATIAALRSTSVGDTPRPEARPEPFTVWPKQKDVNAFYGPVGMNQALLTLPFPMVLSWDKSKIISRISLHEKVVDSAARVFDRIADAYPPADRRATGIDIFGGSLNVRKMRGGSSWSMHSWGIAIDFDPERNQLNWGRDHNPRPRLSYPDLELFWRLWESEGWVSLGRSRDYDWMHVQAARL